MPRCTVDCEVFSSLAICRWVIPLACKSNAFASRSDGISEKRGQTSAWGPTKASARSLEIGESILHVVFLRLVFEFVDMGMLLGDEKWAGTEYSILSTPALQYVQLFTNTVGTVKTSDKDFQ